MHNQKTIWAYAQGLTIHGFSPNEEEAKIAASLIEPIEHAGYTHEGYILDLPPGSIEIEEDYIWFQKNQYPKPLWL